MVTLLLPRINPNMFEGRGPYTPVPKAWGPISGVNTVWEVEQRSNLALPGVALLSCETDCGWLVQN